MFQHSPGVPSWELSAIPWQGLATKNLDRRALGYQSGNRSRRQRRDKLGAIQRSDIGLQLGIAHGGHAPRRMIDPIFGGAAVATGCVTPVMFDNKRLHAAGQWRSVRAIDPSPDMLPTLIESPAIGQSRAYGQQRRPMPPLRRLQLAAIGKVMYCS